MRKFNSHSIPIRLNLLFAIVILLFMAIIGRLLYCLLYTSSTLMYYLYEKAFQLTEYGYANTIGVFLAVMIAIVSFAQFKILGNDVEY